MTDTPFIAIGANELGAPVPQQVRCTMCGELHDIKDNYGTDRNGNPTSFSLQTYRCGEKSYLAGIDRRSILNKPSQSCLT